MKKRFFYGMISAVTVLLCIPGCTEGTVSEGESDKRAIDADESSVEREAETTVTTLTPLETFERLTAFQYRFGEETTAAEDKQEKMQETESNESDWFSGHKLFEIETYESHDSDDSDGFIETWYRFQRDEETDGTTIVVIETQAAETGKQTTAVSAASENKSTKTAATTKKK
ncbi:MAG: hypothetical protein ACI4JB_09260 [Porcipelethomonas sp.]